MTQINLESMSPDELWTLYEDIAATLAAKIVAKQELLDVRLRRLKPIGVEQTVRTPDRRPYPTVVPKFRNPEAPSETWAGRGKQPRWLAAQLRLGKQIDEFRVSRPLMRASGAR
jgi:DNA-binding protein H-NS